MTRNAGAALAVLAALALAGPETASAQVAGQPQTGQDTITLTLEDALAVARGTSPAYRQAVNSAGLNPSDWRTTWLTQLVPNATINLFSTDFSGNIQRRATDNFGNPISNPTADWVYFSQTNQGISLNWAVQGSSIFNALDQQRLTNRRRTLAEVQALTDLELSVQRDFFDVQEQEELLRAEEATLAASELDLQVTDRLYRIGQRTQVDLLRAQLAIEQQRLALIRQEASVERVKLQLRTRLGDDELPPFETADTPLPDFDASGLDTDRLVRRAMDSNPRVVSADVAIQSARVDLRDANRAWWPQLDLSYGISRRAQTPETEALFDLSWDEAFDQRFRIGLSIPMFNGYFRNRQSQRQAQVSLANETEAEREVRLEVEQTVRGALLDLEYQDRNLRIYERAAEIAGEALRLSREEYRLGATTYEALRQNIDAEADARIQLIQARHAAHDALLDLEAAVGVRLRD